MCESILPLSCYNDIENIMNILNNMRFLNDDPRQCLFFRGHANRTWKLSPTISRINGSNKKPKESESIIMNRLESAIRKKECHDLRSEPSYTEDSRFWQILFQAQHLEFPTRLLDLTISIYHAIFFACYSDDWKSTEGELIAFYWPLDKLYGDSRDNILKNINDYRVDDIDDLIMINPGIHIEHLKDDVIAAKRRSNQFGRFLLFPDQYLSTSLESIPNFTYKIRRFSIPANSKNIILADLESHCNISRETVMFALPYCIRHLNDECRAEILGHNRITN